MKQLCRPDSQLEMMRLHCVCSVCYDALRKRYATCPACGAVWDLKGDYRNPDLLRTWQTPNVGRIVEPR